ncbi:MAG: chain-length determining protein [Sphingomonas bacterium]|nr:XrtA system polysaccharide chain length determinant [Sphingomonas bacterium]MDB5689908.1 chain-length determining protein [Sphingomonas bacterium]
MNGIYQEIRIALHLVWSRRWLALAVAWGVCLLGWLVIALIPNSYESQARIFVQMQSLLPDRIGISTAERQRDIDRVRSTLTSTVVLEKVVRGTDLGLQTQSDADVAAMVERLRQGIEIKQQQDNLFQITARTSAGGMSDAQNAKLARAVVQKLIDVFVEGNLSGDRDETTQTMRFLDEELARRQKQLQEVEQRRVAFEQRYMGLLPGVGSIGQRMDAARAELNNVESALIAAQSSLSAMSGQMAGTPATVAGPAGVAGTVGPNTARVAALEAQLGDAQSRGWTDQHPDVVATRAQLDRIRPLAARERTSGGSGGGSMANPSYVALRSMLAEKQANAAALGARKAQLQSDLAQLTAKQSDEPGVAAEQAAINRDYEVLKTQYDKLLGDREDVRLRSDVSSKTDTVKFSVLDPPSEPRLPVAPNRPLLLALVLVVGLAAGVGAAFGKAQLATTYATADRLARASGLPVIGSISEIVTAPQKVERRKRMMWFAGAGGALAGCFLLLLLVEFVQRSLIA